MLNCATFAGMKHSIRHYEDEFPVFRKIKDILKLNKDNSLLILIRGSLGSYEVLYVAAIDEIFAYCQEELLDYQPLYLSRSFTDLLYHHLCL